MTQGIVLSINPDGISGVVQVDETMENLNFRDTNFPNTGITNQAPNNACMFDVLPDPQSRISGVYYATHLATVPVGQPSTINGPWNKDVVANAGDVITITGAAAVVTGNLISTGGKIIVEQGANVTGNAHQVNGGVFVARKGGTVNGPIGVNQGGNLKVVNKGTLNGNITVNQAGRMIVGNDNGPGFVKGSLTISGLRDMQVTPDSQISL
jgi:hypothetical protein